jgi:hypothetical protein
VSASSEAGPWSRFCSIGVMAAIGLFELVPPDVMRRNSKWCKAEPCAFSSSLGCAPTRANDTQKSI